MINKEEVEDTIEYFESEDIYFDYQIHFDQILHLMFLELVIFDFVMEYVHIYIN